MVKLAHLLAGASLILMLDHPALAQGGDPVPTPTPTPTPQAVQPAVPQGPSFIQIIQQQQQIQNATQNLQFPAYLQANPTITPLDQRSGLANQATKVINLEPTSLKITTVTAPNIVNSNLLAPTQVISTPAQTNSKLDFSSLSTLLNNLQKASEPKVAPTLVSNDFVGELTTKFLNLPNLTTPQDRLKSLLDMSSNFTKLLQLGLLPESARDDLNKLIEIANNPNHPSIKTQDTTTARFYISNILIKLSTNVEGLNIKGITLASINAPDSETFKTISNINKATLERNQKLLAVAETNVKRQDAPLTVATKAISNAASVVVAAITTGGGAPASARAMPVQKQVSTSTTQQSITQQGTAAAGVQKVESTSTQKSTPQGPPQAPVVNTTALQNSLNTATNTLGDLNTRLESKITSLASLTATIAKTTPTATNKQQLDMYKSQQQRLQAEINTLRSDKAVAQNTFLTSYAKIYGTSAANVLSGKIGSTNPDTKTLQSLIAGP